MTRDECMVGSTVRGHGRRTAPHRARPSVQPLEARRLLAAGDLDPSFGTGGTVLTYLGSLPFLVQANAVAIEGDKIVVAGTSVNDFVVARFNGDGSLDDTFGDHGSILDNFSGAVSSTATSVAIQTVNGRPKIVVAGFSRAAGGLTGQPSTFTVARYNDDGTPDIGFGTPILFPDGPRTGSVHTRLRNGDDFANDLVIEGDKIVVVGAANSGILGVNDDVIAVARYDSNGDLDTTFGQPVSSTSTVRLGVALIPIFLFPYGQATSVALQSVNGQGMIVLAGEADLGGAGRQDFVIARLTDSGDLDTSFGDDNLQGGKTGSVTVDFRGGTDVAVGVAVQADNRIVAVGQADVGGNNFDMGIVRVNADGTLDNSFNGTGKKTIGFTSAGSPNQDFAQVVAIQGDQKIVIAGTRSGARPRTSPWCASWPTGTSTPRSPIPAPPRPTSARRPARRRWRSSHPTASSSWPVTPSRRSPWRATCPTLP